MDLTGRLADLDPEALPPGRSVHRLAVGDEAACELLALRGAADGPVLLAVAGVHGDEYEGPAALPRLWAELDPAAVAGTLLLVPVLNESAHFARARCGADGLNLAREFPGRRDGSPTEQIAAALDSLLARVSAFCDLHAAGTFYTLHPWVGYARVDDAALLERQREMAWACELDFVWSAPLKPGRTLTAASARGVPAVYIEMTGAGLCRPDDVDALVTAIRGVAACCGLLERPFRTLPPRWTRDSLDPREDHLQVHHLSPRRGVFAPAVAVWDPIRRGELLGQVASPGGLDPVDILAERTGRVAILRTAPPVDEGDFLAGVVPL